MTESIYLKISSGEVFASTSTIKFEEVASSPNWVSHFVKPDLVWSKANHLSKRHAVLSAYSSIASIISHNGDYSTDGGSSSMWYLEPVPGSILLPRALRRHSFLSQLNQITASKPLGMRVFGGSGLGVGWTKRVASFVSDSLEVGSRSAGIEYPERAFSSNMDWLKLLGKSTITHPVFSTTLMSISSSRLDLSSASTTSMVRFFLRPDFCGAENLSSAISAPSSASSLVNSSSRLASLISFYLRVGLSLYS